MAKINIDKIILDQSIYPRNGVNDFNVARLASALATGSKLPPLIIEATTKRLIDGWHRHQAYKQRGIETVDVKEKTYNSEADLFADAVRLNISHGEPLDSYSVRQSIIRLQQYGYSRDQVSEVVRLPIDRIEKIERGFAFNTAGGPIALKGGISHLRGTTLSESQQETNRHYSGGKATFHVKQLSDLLERNMWPRTQTFAHEMNRLVQLWTAVNKEKQEA
jgi:hypothetical protein